MNNLSNLSLSVDADGIALLNLCVANDPAQHFSAGLAMDLHAVVTEVQARTEIRGVVLTSARPGVFLAGARLDGLLATLGGRPPRAVDVAALLAPIHALMRAIETGGKPWIAAINGSALGGGFELALACHHRLMLDDAALRVGLPEVADGLIPGGGGTQRLPRLIGIPAALPLLLQAKTVAPKDALAAGLVDELQPSCEALLAAAFRRAGEAGAVQPWDRKGWSIPEGAGAMARHAPQSFGLGLARVRSGAGRVRAAGQALLEAVYEGTQLPIHRALALEAKCFAALVASVEETQA